MKHLRFISAILIIAICGISASGAPKISKETQAVMKQLKKDLGAKDVFVFETDPDGNFFGFETKDKFVGIVDRNGNIILQPDFETVIYFPAYNEKELAIDFVNGNFKPNGKTMYVPTEPTKEAFWGLDIARGAKVFDRQGNLITSFKHNALKYNGNYALLESSTSGSTAYEMHAFYDKDKIGREQHFSMITFYNRMYGTGYGMLVRTDGSVVIPETDGITIYAVYPNIMKYYIDTGENTSLYGVKFLDNSLSDIPCIYKFITESGDKWYGSKEINGEMKLDEILIK